MSQIKTIRVKRDNEEIIINESDFNPAQHELCDGEQLSDSKTTTVNSETEELQKMLDDTKEQLTIAQGELITFKDDVVAMQARIDELKAVDYSKMKVEELKDVLALKGIEIPPNAKKDELLALIPKE